MAYKVHFLPDAIQDLDNILDWYVAKNTALAERFYVAYFKVEDRIVDNPFQFPVVENNIRKARILNSFPYTIFFFIENQSAIIVAIFHNRRNPSIWKGRIT